MKIEPLPIIKVPDDWIKKKYNSCVACGALKSDRDKGQCYVYGDIVNNGRHQYIGYVPPSNPTKTDKQ